MSAEPQRTQSEEDAGICAEIGADAGTRLLPGSRPALTRRGTMIFGGKLVAIAGLLTTGFGTLTAEARKKNKKNKNKGKRKRRRKRPSDFRLEVVGMTGGQEVPGPGDNDASGSGECTIRPNRTICCEFEFDPGATASDVNNVHIHEGAVGIQGDPVVDFEGQLDNCVANVDAEIVNAIKANPDQFYANIHTEEFPNGAVRAQLAPAN